MSRRVSDIIIELAQSSTGITGHDVEEAGYSRWNLYDLHKKGLLERVARGVYVSADRNPTEYHTIAIASKRFPSSVVCLLSSLQLHGLTTQIPHQIWLAIEQKQHRPKEPSLPIRVVYFSGKAFTAGIEEHKIEGVSVKVYTPAKTVADCFKYRNKIGLDVAIEALKDAVRQRKCTNDDLYHYAKIQRIWNVMRPYLEAIS